jgi:hypothetical protein
MLAISIEDQLCRSGSFSGSHDAGAPSNPASTSGRTLSTKHPLRSRYNALPGVRARIMNDAASRVSARVTYEINAGDEIVSVGHDWAAFASANGSPELAAGAVGRPLFHFVSDPTTRHVYRELLARVRAGRTISFDYRCDAPALRRFMRMTLRPLADKAVGFDSVTVRVEPRESPWLQAQSDHASPLVLRMCGWCKRVALPDSWEEVEIAVEALGLFGRRALPSITHGMCPACYARMMDTMDAA